MAKNIHNFFTPIVYTFVLLKLLSFLILVLIFFFLDTCTAYFEMYCFCVEEYFVTVLLPYIY